MHLRSGKVLAGPSESPNAQLATGSASQDEDQAKKKIGFFDLPVEIRVRVYGYVVHLPCPLRAGILEETLNDFADPEGSNQDFEAHAADILLRHNTVIFNANTNELIDTMHRQPVRIIRRFRHIRFGGWALIDELRRYENRGTTNEDWLKDDLDAFGKTVQGKIDYLYTLPRATTFAKLDSLWLPNHQTLTLDIGRIDEEPQPCYGYNNTWGHWSIWLDESDAVRNTRYRGVLQRIQTQLPERISKHLKMVVNAKMDPEGPRPFKERMRRGLRPILYAKLKYKVADKNVVEIEERWEEWSYRRRIGYGQQTTEMAEKLEVRRMDWHGPTAEIPESWSVPVWKELGGDLLIQGGKVVEADEEGGVDS